MAAPSTSTQPAEAESSPSPLLALALAWVLPGAGHLYLRRWVRGIAFLALVLTAVIVGAQLEGRLYAFGNGGMLSTLASLAEMGLGIPYFFLRIVTEYEGNIRGAGYEYGTAFLLTGSLMNLLLIFDAWDIARGRKP